MENIVSFVANELKERFSHDVYVDVGEFKDLGNGYISVEIEIVNNSNGMIKIKKLDSHFKIYKYIPLPFTDGERVAEPNDSSMQEYPKPDFLNKRIAPGKSFEEILSFKDTRVKDAWFFIEAVQSGARQPFYTLCILEK